MNSFRAFTFLTFASLLGACGEGMPEPTEQPAPQEQQSEPQVPDESQEQDEAPDVHALVDDDFIYPQETKTFASNWFSRTPIYINNVSGVDVQAHAWCARYAWSQWVTIAPGQTAPLSAPCEGTTIYIHNNASLGSGNNLYATVNN
ncbi:hypothetical protein JRI60_48790 [Archangium violaceum]|uniref:hypothetical protein n=1 Tax=Archangium violaceum TaxID=83451 RepID=UPI0019502940|nr:hypothetical protein [Archangium violaceum]QRN96797.1 hypothetical protein JRI60_48790 [Archangium violaceum]